MSNHPCSFENCQQDAKFVAGHYYVGPRQVRVWACEEHYLTVENPLQEVATPASILQALEIEQAAYDKAERIDRSRVIDLDNRSVHTFRSAGKGHAVGFDRVAAWRWGA